MSLLAESSHAGVDMILHEFTRTCSGVGVHFDVVVMPGMVWLYIGDGEMRFDALSFAAGNQGQKIPSSSCLMKGTEEDRGFPVAHFAVPFRFPLVNRIFQVKS